MGDHAIDEARIALENIRASAHAFAEMLGEIRARDGAVATTDLALLRRAELPAFEDTMKALATLSRASTDLIRHGRAQIAQHPNLALAARRLESDLCIAAGVIQAIDRERTEHPEHASGMHRAARRIG